MSVSVRRLAPPIPIALLLLAFAVRTIGLSAQSLWYDEGYTAIFAQRSIGDVIAGAAQRELNTPLHYLVLKLWMALTGPSEFSLRFLSAAAGLVTVALVFAIARQVSCQIGNVDLGRRGADKVDERPPAPAGPVLAMLLVTLSPVCVLMARELRMYALAACLCTASTWVFVVCLRRTQAGLWVIWALVSLAAFATHVLAAFFIFSQIGVLALTRIRQSRSARVPRATRVGVYLALLVLLSMGLAAALILRGSASYGTSFRDRLDPLTTLEASVASQVLPRLLPASLTAPTAIVAGLLAAGAGVVALRRRSLRPSHPTVWFVSGATIILIALFCVVTGKFSSRYPALAAPLFWVSVALALVSLDQAKEPSATRWLSSTLQWARALAAGMVVAGLGIGLWQLYGDPVYANDDWRGVARMVKASAKPDEAILLVSGHTAPMFSYYYDAPGWTAVPGDAVLDISHALTWESAMPTLNAALAGRAGAWLVLWQNDLIDPTGLVPALLRRQSQAFAPALDTTEFNGLRLEHYRFFQPYRPLAVTLPPSDSRIEKTGRVVGLTGLGCNQPQVAQTGDGWLELDCFWQVKPFVQLSPFTKVSLRLLDASGRGIVQSDQPLAPNGMPYFPFEKPILGLYLIELPPDIAPGDYSLRAIPYAEQGELSPQVVTPIHILPKLPNATSP